MCLFDVPTFKPGIYAVLAGGIDLEAVQSRPQKPEKKEDNSKWEATVIVVVARLV